MDPDYQSRVSTEDIARIKNLMLSCLPSNAVLSTAIPLVNRICRPDAHAASHAHTVRLNLEQWETLEIIEEQLQRLTVSILQTRDLLLMLNQFAPDS